MLAFQAVPGFRVCRQFCHPVGHVRGSGLQAPQAKGGGGGGPGLAPNHWWVFSISSNFCNEVLFKRIFFCQNVKNIFS